MDPQGGRDETARNWSFNRLGPFHALQERLGLITGTELHAGRRAVLFAALAYVPTLLLALLQGYALGEQHQRALLFDFGAYATVVAIAAFVLMEQSSDWRMRVMMHKFISQDLLTPADRPRIEQARQAMERRTGAWWAEAVLLVVAYVFAYRWQFAVAQRIDGGTWVGRVVDGHFQLTLSGMWALAVLMPLFLFLFGRWLWRFCTWGWLLRDIARCELRLVATHADRCGGLAFIGQYPKTYMMFVFAFSTIVSAATAKQVIYAGASLLSFKFAAIGMVVFLVVFFVLPLFAFTPRLTRLKFDGLTMYSGLISRHNLAFEAKWLTGAAPPPANEAVGSPDMSSLADLSLSYDLVKRILPVPVVTEGIVPLIGVAVLPMLVVVATQVPITQLVASLKELLPI